MRLAEYQEQDPTFFASTPFPTLGDRETRNINRDMSNHNRVRLHTHLQAKIAVGAPSTTVQNTYEQVACSKKSWGISNVMYLLSWVAINLLGSKLAFRYCNKVKNIATSAGSKD